MKNSSIGSKWSDVEKGLFTPEEIADSNSRVADALKEVQASFAGVADSMGLKNDDDIVALVKAHRKNKGENRTKDALLSFTGCHSEEDGRAYLEALKDCERIDVDEW